MFLKPPGNVYKLCVSGGNINLSIYAIMIYFER